MDLRYIREKEEMQKKVRILEEQYEAQKQMMQMTTLYLDEVNHELSLAKDEVERMNKNLVDSIKYSKRIQSAMLLSQNKVKSIFPNSFIYHKSKDILSGDFYWFCETEEKKFAAAIDCTGHGVPGALLSVMANTTLNDLVNNYNINSPLKILLELDRKIHHHFNNKNENISFNDGLDIILCVFDKNDSSIEFASAHRPLYHIKNGQLITYKGTRYSIGENSDRQKLIINYKLSYSQGDILYLTSDGFVDQFGGHSFKKFGPKMFKSLLQSISKKPMTEQKNIVENTLKKWKGDNRQTDDILVIGLKF